MSNFNSVNASAAANILKRGDKQEIRSNLSSMLGGLGIARSFHDENPHLSLLREVKLVDGEARSATIEATLELLSEAIENIPESDPALLLEIVRFSAGLKDPRINDLLTRFALGFNTKHPLGSNYRQAVLGVLVDVTPSLDESFWVAIYNCDPENHVGMVSSGLMNTNPISAVSFYPEVIKSKMGCSIVTLVADLKWDEMVSAHQAEFIEAVKNILPKCNQAFTASLEEWVNSKSTLGSV